ncbi:hypothetical protein KAU92_03920, partial [Candidatus Bathyarchaeota archaeon]|nr:hypothetical protein [Candidatus Bathyarchaeota archaeon]
MKIRNSELLEKLDRHKQSLEDQIRKASEFLVRCQIVEPYVERGMLHGCICPWEIGVSAEEGAFPILEDFHDTLEAIWVWSYYSKVSSEQTFKPNIDRAWKYIVKNWKRFIEDETWDRSLYDCSSVLLSGTLHRKIFNDDKYEKMVMRAGNHLRKYLS